MSTSPFLNIYFPDFLAIFIDFLKHFLWLDLDPEPWTQPLRTINYLSIFYRLFIHCSWFSKYKTKVISKFIYICLFVLKTNAIVKLSSKAILLHPSNNLFLFCVIPSRGRQKILKCAADAYFRVCLYIFTNSFDPIETKKFLVSALMCTLFPNLAIS